MTADELTEDQIRAELELAWMGRDKKMQTYCERALVPDGQRVVSVWWDAREHVAAYITNRNSMREDEPCADGECKHSYDDWPASAVTASDRGYDQCPSCGWTENEVTARTRGGKIVSSDDLAEVEELLDDDGGHWPGRDLRQKALSDAIAELRALRAEKSGNSEWTRHVVSCAALEVLQSRGPSGAWDDDADIALAIADLVTERLSAPRCPHGRMPASAGAGHWREWHRGHGCHLDPDAKGDDRG